MLKWFKMEINFLLVILESMRSQVPSGALSLWDYPYSAVPFVFLLKMFLLVVATYVSLPGSKIVGCGRWLPTVPGSPGLTVLWMLSCGEARSQTQKVSGTLSSTFKSKRLRGRPRLCLWSSAWFIVSFSRTDG